MIKINWIAVSAATVQVSVILIFTSIAYNIGFSSGRMDSLSKQIQIEVTETEELASRYEALNRKIEAVTKQMEDASQSIHKQMQDLTRDIDFATEQLQGINLTP
jgi:uncharacterized protein YoxC